MISDQRDASCGPGNCAIVSIGQRYTNQIRAAMPLFSESAQYEIRPQTAEFHLAPRDRAQISCDERDRNARLFQLHQKTGRTGTEFICQIVRVIVQVDLLSYSCEFRQMYSYLVFSHTNLFQHQPEKLAVQHAMCRYVVQRGTFAGDQSHRFGQRPLVVRARSANESTIYVEQYESAGRQA